MLFNRSGGWLARAPRVGWDREGAEEGEVEEVDPLRPVDDLQGVARLKERAPDRGVPEVPADRLPFPRHVLDVLHVVYAVDERIPKVLPASPLCVQLPH